MNVTASICSNCLSGQYSDDEGSPSCKFASKGFEVSSSRTFETPCSIGKYMPPGDGQDCESCPEGFYQGNLNATACSRVGPGYRASTEKPGAPQQIGCPKGKYSQGQAVNCTPCLTGTYQDNETSSSCAACPTGWIANNEGSQKCDRESPSTISEVPTWKSSMTSGKQLSVVYDSNCPTTTRIYYDDDRNADNFVKSQEGPVLRLNRSGWQEVLYTKALCETSSSVGTFSDVTESWTVASDCDEGYLQVYEDESKREQFRPLRPKNGPVCRPCPFGAACLKDTVGTEASLRPKPGYWRIPWSETFGECAECLQEKACNTTGCIYPYTGPLCAMCEPGFTRGPGRICAPCPSEGANAAITSLIFVASGAALSYLIYDGVSGATEIEAKGVLPFHTLSLRTLISYLQVASMIRLYEMELPAAVDGLVTVETFASSAGDALVSIDCSSRAPPFDLFLTKQILVYTAPVVIVVVLSAFHFVRKAIGRVEGTMAWDQFIASAMVLMNLLYPTLVKRSALIFSCRSIGGRRFLDESLDVRCFAPEHVGAILTTALPGILLYVVGFPLGLLLVLLRLKARGALKHSESTYDRRWVLRLGFLFAGYEDEHVYWESLVLFRKALLSGAAVFLAHSGTTVQVVVAVLILFVSYALQMNYRPLEHDWHDLMEERSLLCSTLILIVCLLGNADSGTTGLSVGWSLVVSGVVLPITILFMWTSIRLTLNGMHHGSDEEEEKNCIERVATACLARFQCCKIDDGDGTSLTKRGGMGRMEGPRPVKASEQDIEMVSVEGVEWRTNDQYGHGKGEKLPQGWQRRFSAEDDEWYYVNDETEESVWTREEIDDYRT